MSVTSDLIDQVHQAFDAASTSGQHNDLSRDEMLSRGEIDMGRAQKMIDATVSVEAALEAAHLLGESHAFAEALDLDLLARKSKSLLAHAIFRMVAPNRDECRVHACQLFEDLALEAHQKRDRATEAIELTNAAVCLLEMHNLTSEETLKAERICQKTVRMREKNTVDFAYSLMNLALAERMALGLKNEPDRRSVYGRILRDLDKSVAVFKKHSPESGEYKQKYHVNVVDTLTSWLSYEISVETQRLDEEAFHKQKELKGPGSLGAGEICRILRANPKVLGLHDTPQWVPTESDSVKSAVAKVSRLKQRISKAEKYADASSRSNTTLRLKLFSLKSMLASLEGDSPPPWEALDRVWERGDLGLYLIHAARFLGGNSSAKWDDPRRYRQLLSRVSQCIVTFRKFWTADEVARLLSDNELTFRLAACEFARLAEWEAAFELLEFSRGLNSSRSWADDPQKHLTVVDGVSWVHITHSPYATYVVQRIGTEYDGAEFTGLAGKVLVPYFNKLAGMDLSNPGRGDRPQTRELVETIEELIRPAADHISATSGQLVALMPGGFYQAFPVWACGQLGEGLVRRTKRITSVPSRSVALRNAEMARDSASDRGVFIANASGVPGCASLPWSSNEGTAIRQLLEGRLGVEEEDATDGSVFQGLREGAIFHFTGHSAADLDPKNSALISYTGPIRVGEILESNCSAGLAFFGSCESGLAMNFLHQDEMLSIQTSAYYAGAKMAVGTTWPVWDAPAFYFAFRFYSHLARFEDPVAASAIISAYSNAVADTKHAINSEVRELGLSFGIASVPPDNGDTAFHFLDWAAFGLVGVDGSHL